MGRQAELGEYCLTVDVIITDWENQVVHSWQKAVKNRIDAETVMENIKVVFDG